jgi:hypothetical protein
MKKNLAIYMVILTMTMSFSANSYGQVQDWVNLIKGAIDKNKEKKKKEEEKGKTNEEKSTSGTGQTEILYNQFAPEDYDAKLKVNDLAIGVYDKSLEPIRIAAINEGLVKGIRLAYPDFPPMVFKVNSVYPYFDKQEFMAIAAENKSLISPLLECYAKKYNIKPEHIYSFGIDFYYRGTVEEFKNLLAKNRAGLKQVEAKIKSLQSQPNTFLGMNDNPGFWLDVIANIDELERCAIAKVEESSAADDDKSTDLWYINDIKQLQKEVESYTPETQVSLTYSLKQHDYVLLAVSQRERAKWFEEWKKSINERQKVRISKALDELAAAAAKKLPTYKADLADYKVRNPLEEKLMKGVFDDITQYQILSIGLIERNWLIAYNDFGIPTARYKHGAIYNRYKNDDHPYCYLTYVNIKQDYAGGGTWGASYARYISDELVGCPAGVR